MSKFNEIAGTKLSYRLVGSIKAIQQIQEKNSDEKILEAYFYLDGDNKPYRLNIDKPDLEELKGNLGETVEILAVRDYPSTIHKEATEPLFPEENAFIGELWEYGLRDLER